MDNIIPLNGKTKYQMEKEQGLRTQSGALKLKRLTGKHLTCINYHLAGGKNGDIAKAMRVSEAWISTVLNDPLSQELIERRFHLLDMELRGLMPKAVDALRSALDNADPNVQLSAADKFFRTQGFYTPKKGEDKNVTAEDLVRMLLEKTDPGTTTTLGITVRKSEDGVS